jgi:hypothetical protein
VIVIDWDLEAPGVESFFTRDPDEREALRGKLGLIDMFLAYKEVFPSLPIPAKPAAPVVAAPTSDGPAAPASQVEDAQQVAANRDRLEKIVEILNEVLPPLAHVLAPIRSTSLESGGPALSLLTAGSRSGARFNSYAESVQEFDWEEFYAQFEGEAYIEWIRRQLVDPQLADVILIDSRTGVAEMNGACTRQMADVIVMLCAPNDQNLEGAARMAASFTRPGVIAARGERAIDLIMVPARLDVSEGRPVDLFEINFRKTFEPFVPEMFKALNVGFSKLRIPYISAYAYSERLAIGDAQGVRALQDAYVTLAAHIAALAPPDSALKRRSLKAVQDTFGLPTVLVVELGSDTAALTAQLRMRIEGAGAVTVLSTSSGAVLDPSLARGGPGGGPVPVVVPITTGMLGGGEVRDLCRRARQQGLCVALVTDSGSVVPEQVPRWAGRLRMFDVQRDGQALVSEVLTPCRRARVPFLAPPMPALFVGRQQELAQARSLLLDERSGRPAGLALVGIGGAGKSAFAAAICHDDDVIDAFDDGILWASFGGPAANLLEIYAGLIGSFSAEATAPATVEEARRVLTDILNTRRCLIVLDDLWDAPQAVVPDPRSESRFLVTARTLDVASELGAAVVTVPALSLSDARTVLTAALPGVDTSAAADLANGLGRLPLALHLANRQIRTRIELGDSPSNAVHEFATELATEGLGALEVEGPTDPGRSILASLRLSIERLNPTDRSRVPAFADITPDVALPVAAVAAQIGLSESDTEPLVRRLASVSLLTFDAATRMVTVPSIAVEFFKTLQVRQRLDETKFSPRERSASSSSIFVCYRRSAGRMAQRIGDRLVRHFGYDNVFVDISSIPAGVDFRSAIESRIASSSLVVAIIDEGWSSRLGPDDLLTAELAFALAHDIPVIPVLIEPALMPSPSELPSELKKLAYRNALALNLREFQSGIDLLIRSIEHFHEAPAAPAASPATVPEQVAMKRWLKDVPVPASPRRGRVLVAVASMVILLAGALAVFWAQSRSSSSVVEAPPAQGTQGQQSTAPPTPAQTPPVTPATPPVTAEQGTPNAQVLFSQAEDLLLGRTGPRDVAKAVALYRQAAAAGSSSAMNTLGRLYETGEGVTRNEATALQWYQRAAGAGHPDAIASVTRLQRRGAPSRKPDAKP